MFFGFAYPAAKGVRSIYVLDQQLTHNQNNVSPEDVEAALSLYIIVEYWLRIFLFFTLGRVYSGQFTLLFIVVVQYVCFAPFSGSALDFDYEINVMDR